MVIHQFNRIIRNKWIWGAFAIAISAFFAFDFLLTGGDPGERRSSAGELNGEEVQDDRIYVVGIQEFHYNNLEDFFNVTHAEVEANGKPSILTTSDVQTLLGYFEENKHLGLGVEGRLEVID